MKKISLLIMTVVLGLNLNAQKVKKEKYMFPFQQYPLINLPSELTNYSSETVRLKFFSKENVSQGEYSITGKIYPMNRLKGKWGKPLESYLFMNETSINLSQPFKITLKDKNDKIIYYRIFNYLEENSIERFTSKIEDSHKMSKYGKASLQLSRLFEKRMNEIKVQLFYIAKSENHSDINKAYQLCLDAISASKNSEIEKTQTLLNQAIEIWEEALKEAQLTNKKARINKKTAVGIYKNLIQILPFVNRFDDALALCSTYENTFNGLSYNYARQKRLMIERFRLNNRSKLNEGYFKFSEIELEDIKKPTQLNDELFCINNSKEITDMITGSWRLFYESFKLPQDIEKEKLDRNPNSTCDDELIIHLDQGGNNLIQTGSWETDCEQKFDDFTPFWKILKRDNGIYYLCFSMDKDGFENPDNIFKILHMTQDRLVVEGLTYPDGDTTTESIMQFKKISLITHDKNL
ncbi:hypothetical protein ACXR6G_04640 [Ancylomarina sp. YFZ004]